MRVKSAPLFKILKSAKISQNTIILHKYLFNNLYFLGITCDIFRTDTFIQMIVGNEILSLWIAIIQFHKPILKTSKLCSYFFTFILF